MPPENLKKEVESELDNSFKWKNLEKGLNTIYILESDNEDYILKVHTNPENKIGWFKAEPEIYHLISENLDIPSPKVLYKDFSEEHHDNSFYIMEKMPGQNPEEIKEELSQENLEEIIYYYGKILGKVHKLTNFESYGLISADEQELKVTENSNQWCWSLKGAMDSWKSIIEDKWDNPPELVMPEKEVFEKLLPTDPGSKLLHSDNRLDNLLVQDSNITAFLDWSHPRAGSEEYDLVRAEYLLIDWDLGFRTEPLEKKSKLREKLYKGYSDETGFKKDSEFQDRRQIYRYATTFWIAAGFANWGSNLDEDKHGKMRNKILDKLKAEEP